MPTLLCHRYVPNKISACVPVCCTQLRRRRQSTRSPWRRCSTGCCGTGVPGSRRPTRAVGDSWELFCQPCSVVFCFEANGWCFFIHRRDEPSHSVPFIRSVRCQRSFVRSKTNGSMTCFNSSEVHNFRRLA